MKGDLSRWQEPDTANYMGVLHQQGRVLGDQDGNAVTNISRHLRELLGKDTIGADLVGVPASEPDGLFVSSADNDGTSIKVSVEPGRCWADGLHLYVPGDAPLELTARYLEPPLQVSALTPADVTAGDRDALILEVWEEAFSAYQDPRTLIEPALGGPDTTGRIRLGWTLRLLRLNEGEDCGNIAGRLTDDPDDQGHLTVEPAPVAEEDGDCPIQLGGGYTGFEHYLYRIEITKPFVDGKSRFKWSRFNGGLVGRGHLNPAGTEVVVVDNDQMINQSGLTSFFMEVIVAGPNDDPGRFQVAMTADVTLVSDGHLSIGTVQDGAWPGANADEMFIRLWDGTKLVEDFPTGLATSNPLENGILLAFDAPELDGSNYRPGDHWTFPVRAAGVDFDPTVWPSDAPPQGVQYHRAPLAVLHWDAAPPTALSGPPEIADCRRVFQPLTKLQTCCTYKVGDGLHSFGDFDSIQEAVEHLPASGGEICVLPGTYAEAVQIDKDNVRIHGCGERSRVLSLAPEDETEPAPVFHVSGRTNVTIENLYVEAHARGVGILVNRVEEEGSAFIALKKLSVVAAADAAIKVIDAVEVEVRDCIIDMADVSSPWPGLYLLADDVLIEHNAIRVVPSVQPGAMALVEQPSAGRGGIQIAGTSERVAIIDNDIEGGVGQGITLGSLVRVDESGEVSEEPTGVIIDDECDPCAPGDSSVPPPKEEGDPEYRSQGALYDVRVERNRIRGMGLSGIGVVAFFDLSQQDELISVVGLDVLGNTISECLWRDVQTPDATIEDFIGYGGVSLADVERLRLYDNYIENNGLDQRKPVCGVFVLHGEGLDISRNRITDNGKKVEGADDKIQSGRRGGIVVVFAIPGIVPLDIGDLSLPRQNGVPALRVHENVVSQPLGQALFIGALGAVSVQSNALTSRGQVRETVSLLASTVAIMNLGVSNELYLQFVLTAFTQILADPNLSVDAKVTEDEIAFTGRPGLDDSSLGAYMANGNVSFTDNQVATDWTDPEVSFALSAVTIFTLDDVIFSDNQLDADFLIDVLLTQTLILGTSVRIADNRFKETLILALFSSIGLGLFFNHTVNNQATHCMLSIPSPLGSLPILNPELIHKDNMELFDWFTGGELCATLGKALGGGFGAKGDPAVPVATEAEAPMEAEAATELAGPGVE